MSAERTEAFQGSPNNKNFDPIMEAATQVKADVEKLVEGFDLHTVIKRVDEFGRSNPAGLALTALTFGVALGFLMNNRRPEIHQ